MCSTAAAITAVLSKVAQVLKQSRLQHLLRAGATAAGRSPELTVRSRSDRSISTWHRLAAKKHQVTKWEVGKSLQRKKKKKVDKARQAFLREILQEHLLPHHLMHCWSSWPWQHLSLGSAVLLEECHIFNSKISVLTPFWSSNKLVFCIAVKLKGKPLFSSLNVFLFNAVTGTLDFFPPHVHH